MDALWARADFVWTLTWLGHGCFVGTDGLWVDVNMVGTCMLCGNGRMLDASTGKNTGKRKKLTIKQTRMPPICEKNTHDNARYVQETQENARENKARPPKVTPYHLIPRKG